MIPHRLANHDSKGVLLNRPALAPKAIVMFMTCIFFAAIACQNVVGNSPSLPDQLSQCVRPSCEDVEVKKGDLRLGVIQEGVLTFSNKSDISFEVSGKIAELFVSLGDAIQIGQPIASLDTAGFELAIAEVSIDLKFAKARLKQSMQPLTSEELFETNLNVSAAQMRLDKLEEELVQLNSGPTKEEIDDEESKKIDSELSIEAVEQALDMAMDGPTEVAKAEARALVASAILQLENSKIRLAELITEREPLMVRQLEIDLELAKVSFEETKRRLEILERGPDPEVVARKKRNLVIHQILYEKKQLAFSLLIEKRRASELELSIAKSELELAEESLDIAQVEFDLAKSGPTDGELADAKKTVTVAEFEVRFAQQALAPATAKELAEAEATHAQNTLALLSAQEQSAKLEEGVSQLMIRELENNLEIERSRYENHVETLTFLKTGPNQADILSKQVEIVSAKKDFDQALRDVEMLNNDRSESQIQLNAIKLEVALSALAEAEQRLNRSVILAPFSGIVVFVAAEIGQRVESNDRILRLVDKSELSVVFEATEVDLGNLRVGQSAQINVLEMNTISPAHVVSIEPIESATQNGVIYQVTVSGDGPISADFREGMLARTEVFIQESLDVLLVPVLALKQNLLETSVEVVEGGTTTRVPVRAGLKNGNFVEITDGLKENDVVRLRLPRSELLSR